MSDKDEFDWENFDETVNVGPHVRVLNNGARIVDMKSFLADPEVQKQLLNLPE